MNILILDDDLNRHKVFKKKTIGHSITSVFTVEQAIDALSNNTYDIIFLDHDLSGEELCESGKDTGYAVAQWIASNKNNIRFETVVIHSFNPTGCRNMSSVLENAGIKTILDPFPCKKVLY